MFNRKNVLVVILSVFVIFTGVIYAQRDEEPQNKNDQFEITEKSKENKENTELENEIKEKTKTESDISTELLDEQNSITEDTGKNKVLSSNQNDINNTADKTARIIEFEELFKIHPQTESLYQEYQAKKKKIKEGSSSEKDIKELKESYLPLVIENTKKDLKKFTEANNIDTLIVNKKIVIGDDEYYPDKLTDIDNKTEEFKNFLNK